MKFTTTTLLLLSITKKSIKIHANFFFQLYVAFLSNEDSNCKV